MVLARYNPTELKTFMAFIDAATPLPPNLILTGIMWQNYVKTGDFFDSEIQEGILKDFPTQFERLGSLTMRFLYSVYGVIPATHNMVLKKTSSISNTLFS